MSITPQELAEQIHIARKAKGWTLKECADHAGIGKTAMFDLEHGNPGVRLNTLLAVLDQLGLSLHLESPSPISHLPSPPAQPEDGPVTPKRSEGGSPISNLQSPATESPTLPDHLL